VKSFFVASGCQSVQRKALFQALHDARDGQGDEPSESLTKRIDAIEDAIIASDDPCGECAPTRSSETFYEFYWEAYGDTPEDIGYGYNPRDASFLCAIQKRFVELYPGLGRSEP
jgi:hypothetical protein